MILTDDDMIQMLDLELEKYTPEEMAAKNEHNRKIWLLIYTIKMGLIETAYLVGNSKDFIPEHKEKYGL